MEYPLNILKRSLQDCVNEYERMVKTVHSKHPTELNDALLCVKERMKSIEYAIKILQEFNFSELPGS